MAQHDRFLGQTGKNQAVNNANSMLDGVALFTLEFNFPVMRLFSRLLWISTFLLATYSWMVAFEHGFAWNGFREGFKSEWRNLGALIMANPQGVLAPATGKS